MVLIAWLWLILDDGKSVSPVAVDDLSAYFVPSLALHGDDCMFYTVMRGGGGPALNVNLYHVDTKTMQVSRLTDGRFPSIGNVAYLSGRFILYGKSQGKVIVLNDEMRFGRQTSFRELLNEKNDLAEPEYISPYRDGKSLLTFQKDGQFLLGVFNGEHLDWVASFQPDPNQSAIWCFADGQVFLVEPERGKISLAGKDFLPTKTLIPAKDLVESSYGSLSVRGSSISGLAYKKQLTSVTVHENFLAATVMQFSDLEGRPIKKPIIHREHYTIAGKIKSDPQKMIIASNRNRKLMFLINESYFELN